MEQPTMDVDGYPTSDTLEAIRTWDPTDTTGCLEFCREAWRWSDDYWAIEDDQHKAATGGWSGNESIIGALRRNHVLWGRIWQSSHRGGLHVFEVSDQ